MREQILRGFGYLTLDPSPRLRRLRERAQDDMRVRAGWHAGPLPSLPESAYGPDAVPLDPSGVPHSPP